MTDLSGYFLNMAVADPSCAQQVSYQPPTSYWGQQPLTYYPPPQSVPSQRFPVQLPAQTQPGYMPASYQNYVPVPPAPPQPETLPVYNPMQFYQSPQQNQGYMISNPNQVVYAQNPVYTQNYPSYPPNTPTPNSPHTYNPFPQTQSYAQQGFDGRNSRNQVKNGGKGYGQRMVYNQSQQGSNHSSGGSSSPANTVISGYFPNPMNYRQCTPPETPTQNIAFGYPPNYMQQSMIFRPVSTLD